MGEGWVCPFPVTCRFPEKLDLASSGEGYLGVITAVTQTARCPVASGCHQKAGGSSLSLGPICWSPDFSRELPGTLRDWATLYQ